MTQASNTRNAASLEEATGYVCRTGMHDFGSLLHCCHLATYEFALRNSQQAAIVGSRGIQGIRRGRVDVNSCWGLSDNQKTDGVVYALAHLL